MGFLSDLLDNPVGALTGATAAGRQVNRATGQANRLAAEQLGPFTDAVPGLLSQLLSGDLNIGQDPGYRFRLNQGLDAVQNRFAASGSPFSGSAARALNDYAQGLASQDYGNRYTRLSDLLRLGYGARSGLAGIQAGNLADAGQFGGRATQVGFSQAQELARMLLPALFA